MADQDPNNFTSGSGEESPSEYGPTYYAPVELPLPRLPNRPFWMVALALIFVVGSWLPLAIIARARQSTSPDPRVQLMQDMGVQSRFSAQMTNPLFADDREMRPEIPGTVPRGPGRQDPALDRGFYRVYDPYNGKSSVVFYTEIPRQLAGSPRQWRQLLMRGQERFDIYCYVCHGYDGSGRGPVNQRAVQLRSDGVAGMTWTDAAVLTGDAIRAEPDGKIFNTITNGIRTMPSYGGQIPAQDRWAIVAYVRALQLSQNAPPSLLTQPQRQGLEGK